MRIAIIMFAAMLLVPGCSDDGPTGPSNFAQVVVTVVDEAGDPMPDMELNILNDNDYMQDGKGAKATTSNVFVLPVSCHANIVIADVAGRVIRTLVDDILSAGVYQVQWNGQNDAGEHMASGYYETRMVCKGDGGTLLYGDAQPMLMALLDMDRMVVGRTDDDGRIVLTDRTLFPHLYDTFEMYAYDESGVAMGIIELTALMRFYLRPEGDGRFGQRYDVEVTSAGQNIELTWVESAAVEYEDVSERRPPDPGTKNEPGDPVFALRPCFPNPFN